MALAVALRARPEADAGPPTLEGHFAVHVSVRGGRHPVRLYLYFDGDLVGTWDATADVYAFRAPLPPGPRHAVTVRAIDADGRWGGASAMLEA